MRSIQAALAVSDGRGSGPARSLYRCGCGPRRGHGRGGRRRYRTAGTASPARWRAGWSPRGCSATHQLPRTGTAARRCGRSRRAKTRMPAGQPASWSPPGPSRSSPVSSATCASWSQHSAHRRSERSAQLSSARRPGPGRCGRWRSARLAPARRDRLAFPLAQAPADGVDLAAAGPGRKLIEAGDQPVAGPRAVAGDHQPPPVLRRHRGDRLLQHPAGDQRWYSRLPLPGRSIPASGSAVLSQ